MLVDARLVEPDDHLWVDVLESAQHDFYHRPEYAVLLARYQGGTARAALVQDGTRSLLVPLVLRPIVGSTADAISPYGYAGPLLSGAPDPSFLETSFARAMALLREEGL